MVKLKGPSLATDAAGGLGEILTFSQSKGRAYAKKWSKPRNPSTAHQKAMRAVMGFCSEEWSGFSSAAKALWQPLATAANVSPFNAYLSFNVRNARDGLAPSQMPDPSRLGGFGSTHSRTATGVSRGVRFDIDVNLISTGWASRIYHLPTSGHPATWDHLLHMLNRQSAGIATWTWRPIAPGTYYFAVVPSNINGRLFTGQTNLSATVT